MANVNIHFSLRIQINRNVGLFKNELKIQLSEQCDKYPTSILSKIFNICLTGHIYNCKHISTDLLSDNFPEKNRIIEANYFATHVKYSSR
jgi:hypothetical protein